jgi:hypothetical protein
MIANKVYYYYVTLLIYLLYFCVIGKLHQSEALFNECLQKQLMIYKNDSTNPKVIATLANIDSVKSDIGSYILNIFIILLFLLSHYSNTLYFNSTF